MSIFKPEPLGSISRGVPTYLVFKYVPDLVRMEPRNVGVLVWKDGAVAAKFLPPTPDFVGEDGPYRQWIAYWESRIRKEEISDPATSERIHVTSPKYLEALVNSSKGNYVVAYGGQVLDNVSDLQDAIEYLFRRIVARP